MKKISKNWDIVGNISKKFGKFLEGWADRNFSGQNTAKGSLFFIRWCVTLFVKLIVAPPINRILSLNVYQSKLSWEN